MSSIGIYMPCYNVEKYIRESLISIFKQTFKNWELVIIDDASTDNTYGILNRIYKDTTNDRWKILEKRYEHCGYIGQLKNQCISKFTKKHDYICHVGSDDLIPPYCLQTFVDHMDKHPEIGVCCGNFKCFDDAGNEWAFPHVANSGEFSPDTLLQYMCLFPLRFYRKSVVDQVGGYSNELTSAVDYDLALRLVEEKDIKICRLKEPITYYYRQHSQQVSTKARPQQDLNAKKALEDALKRRGINGVITNNAPPFNIKYLESKSEDASHFIWGKK